MTERRLIFDQPVTLAGGGPFDHVMLKEALSVAPVLIAADGAADRLAGWGEIPRAVIGDMDSIADMAVWQSRPSEIVHFSEQDSTDFEKCLYATEAPFYVGTGFTGGRMDHTLAAFHVMLARRDKTVILLSEVEVIALLPDGVKIDVDVAPGALVSFFPLMPAKGVQSSGLRWPTDNLELAPGVMTSTSNQAIDGRVSVRFDGAGVLMFLERRYLKALIRAVAGKA